jgi:hypothetical protein
MKKTTLSVLAVASLVCLSPFSSNAQDRVQVAPVLPSAQEIASLAAKHYSVVGKNRQARAEYTWQYRTEVWSKGVLQWVDLVNANLDAELKPVYTQVNREQTVDQRRGLLSRGEQRENFDQIDKEISYISEWLTFYSWMPLSRVTELFDKAARGNTVSLASNDGNLLKVEGRNIRDSDAGDFVSLYLHREAAYPVQLTFVVPVITADKDGDDPKQETITATIYYRYLRNGEAFYADHVDVAVPSRQLRLKVESLNMMKKP